MQYVQLITDTTNGFDVLGGACTISVTQTIKTQNPLPFYKCRGLKLTFH